MPRWSHATYAVQSVPHWKIFVFGGVGGEITGTNQQGTFMNDVSIFDTGTERWMSPSVEGEPPLPRGDMELEYYQQVRCLASTRRSIDRQTNYTMVLADLDVVKVFGEGRSIFEADRPKCAIREGNCCCSEDGQIVGSVTDSPWMWALLLDHLTPSWMSSLIMVLSPVKHCSKCMGSTSSTPTMSP